MERKFDPRTIVTPYAFAVHPDLLGMPLATPWQRFGAISIDLVVIGFLSLVGLGPLAIVSTVFLFWLATRKPNRDTVGKFFRIAVGCLGVTILGISALVIFVKNNGPVQEVIEQVMTQVEAPSEGDSPSEVTPSAGDDAGDDAGDRDPGFADVAQGVLAAINLQSAENEEEAQTIINDFVQGSFGAGMSRSQIRDLVQEILPEDAVWASSADEIVNRAMATLPSAGQATPPSQELTGEGEDPLSAAGLDSIENLNRELMLARENQEDLQGALEQTNEVLDSTNVLLEEERNRGPFGWLLGIIDDIGIGSMWAALYLTITHAWWKGKSIGKKLFGIRVVMIDKRPLSWWLSFERTGGYAAGFATGLLGFAQVFWDPNRQAIHDKVSETIVIKDGMAPVPGPWIQEGKAQWTRGQHGQNEEKP